MKLHPSIKFVALGLVGVGGFLAGRISSPGSAPAVDPAAANGGNVSRSASRLAAGASGSKEKSRAFRSERASAGRSQDRLKRLEAIMRGENALDRSRALLAFIDQLAPGDFEDAIEHFRSLGLGDDRNGELALLLSAWAGTDPLAALAYAREKTNGGFAINTILTSWATTDPEAAILWAKANHEGDEGNRFYVGIIRGLAGSDPVRATSLLTSMPRGDERGDAVEEMVPHLLKDGPDAARLWLANITDDGLRNTLVGEIAEPMADLDPKGTVDWLLANPGEAATRRMDDVFEKLAEKDVHEALTSFLAIPAGDTRTNALEGIIGPVAKEDSKAAVAMLDRYAADVNDEIVRTVVWDSFGDDPATAADQIHRITNEGEREQMYRRALGRWMDRDPAATQAWLQKNPVSENVMNSLTNRQQGGRQGGRDR